MHSIQEVIETLNKRNIDYLGDIIQLSAWGDYFDDIMYAIKEHAYHDDNFYAIVNRLIDSGYINIEVGVIPAKSTLLQVCSHMLYLGEHMFLLVREVSIIITDSQFDKPIRMCKNGLALWRKFNTMMQGIHPNYKQESALIFELSLGAVSQLAKSVKTYYDWEFNHYTQLKMFVADCIGYCGDYLYSNMIKIDNQSLPNAFSAYACDAVCYDKTKTYCRLRIMRMSNSTYIFNGSDGSLKNIWFPSDIIPTFVFDDKMAKYNYNSFRSELYNSAEMKEAVYMLIFCYRHLYYDSMTDRVKDVPYAKSRTVRLISDKDKLYK